MKAKLIIAAAIVAALLVGAGIGAAARTAPDPKASAAYKTLASTESSTKAELDAATATVLQDRQTIGNLPALQAQLKADRAQFAAQRSAELAQLAAQRSALQAHARVVNAQYNRIENNDVTDGTYLVGTDMAPGTYRTTGTSDTNCYWQVSADANGSNIVANGNTTGSAFAQVSRGEYFRSDGCNDWIIQR